MWACNTEFQIAYIDCLFVCVSAMTVTGLASINLSTLNGVQQAIIFVQMCMGSIVRMQPRSRGARHKSIILGLTRRLDLSIPSAPPALRSPSPS